MKANIEARRKNTRLHTLRGTSTHPLSATVCAWLMNGPGHFMGLRCYQNIHLQLITKGLTPLSNMGDVLQYIDPEKPAIYFAVLLDSLFRTSNANNHHSPVPMEEEEIKVWFAAILWKVGEARNGKKTILAEYTLCDDPEGSLETTTHGDLRQEAQAYRKPISSMYRNDKTRIDRDTRDPSLRTFSKTISRGLLSQHKGLIYALANCNV
ncbi:hypothetical protein QFC24_006576 [Naganishia onofrii]|uniref:Uncharacterized protein n=1 Tax=Naganishia onofrii TaxID=1851511 RepID=A0ACC2X1G8_9TREE|nr:hypothetical protein QFC24_006576 [Naganishia onofrii]